MEVYMFATYICVIRKKNYSIYVFRRRKKFQVKSKAWHSFVSRQILEGKEPIRLSDMWGQRNVGPFP
jgi:hypothetical protein